MSPDLVPGCALMLAVLLAGASVAGLRARGGLPAAVDAYAILPEGAGKVVAPLLIVAEMLAGIGLALPPTRDAGALLGALLLGSFSLAVLVNVLRGTTEFDCGCGKLLALRPGIALFLRNTTLGFVSVVVMLTPATDVNLRQMTIALLLLVALRCVNAMIARSQWPADD